MPLGRTFWTLLSGCAVYYVMAACSGGSEQVSKSGTSSGGTSSGGASSSSSSGDPGSSSGSPVPNAMADQWYASGTRLKLVYNEASDGAKMFAGFQDSARNERCYFVKHADGSNRCLPAASASITLKKSGCAEDVAYAPKGTPAKYAGRSENGGSRLFDIAGSYSGSVFVQSGASCIDVTGSYAPSFDFYNVGAEITSSSFVTWQEKVAP